MSSLLELACGRVGVINPDRDSKIGTETRIRGGDWQRGGGGIGIGPRDEVGGGRAISGGLGGVTTKTGVTTLGILTRGSVWMETEV